MINVCKMISNGIQLWRIDYCRHLIIQYKLVQGALDKRNILRCKNRR